MKIKFDIRWLIPSSNVELDRHLLPLPTNINTTGSLQAFLTGKNLNNPLIKIKAVEQWSSGAVEQWSISYFLS